MRCFISINIPEEVSLKIQRIQSELPDFYGKKTELENLHLTLKFLGEIGEDKVEKVKEKLREIEFKKYKTCLDYIGFFDNQKYGVVWLHIPKYEGLQKIVDCTTKKVGFDLEKRFMSHLTIARVKSIKDKREFLNGLKKIEIPKIKFNVDKFYLMNSKQRKTGPIYEIIEEYKLS